MGAVATKPGGALSGMVEAAEGSMPLMTWARSLRGSRRHSMWTDPPPSASASGRSVEAAYAGQGPEAASAGASHMVTRERTMTPAKTASAAPCHSVVKPPPSHAACACGGVAGGVAGGAAWPVPGGGVAGGSGRGGAGVGCDSHSGTAHAAGKRATALMAIASCQRRRRTAPAPEAARLARSGHA